MTDTEPTIDLSRLEKVRHHGNKLTARCPSCAEEGKDRKGHHFFLYHSTGKWGCVANSGDREHNRRIFALVGIKGEFSPTPKESRRWRAKRIQEVRESRRQRNLSQEAREKRMAIIERFPWEFGDVWDDSPQRIDCDLVEFSPGHFLSSLFPSEALLWTGQVHHSGPRFANRWRTCEEWEAVSTLNDVGPMTTPAVWRTNSVSRCASNIQSAPYTILDFDGMDGNPPTTPEELQAHLLASLALLRWMREALRAKLGAILYTGGKILHAWIGTPEPEALQSIKNVSQPLGIDAGLIAHPEHTCRLPGQIHLKTGNKSKVLWLRTPQS